MFADSIRASSLNRLHRQAGQKTAPDQRQYVNLALAMREPSTEDIAATATEVSYGPRTDIALIFRSPRRRERGVSRAPLARANTGTKTGAKMAHLAIAGVKNYRRLVEKTAFRGHSPGRAGGAYRGRRRCRARCRSGTFLRCRTPPAPLLLRVTGSCRLYPSATATRRRAGPGSSATPHTTCHRHTG